MDYITVQDKKIPALGYGTWKLSGADCVRGVTMALECGYRHVDTAQIYGNEAEVGKALQGSAVDRADIFLTTKVWIDNLQPDAMARSVEDSLRKLRVDYVDMLLIHWPVEKDAPFATQLAALAAMKERGFTRMIGVSNFTVAQLRYAIEDCGVPISNNQVEYHPYLSQRKILDYLKARDMFLTAYSPIGRGTIVKDPVIGRIAIAHGKKPAQIALRWLVQQGVAAIPKAASAQNMKDNIAIFDFSLSLAEMEEISALARPDGRMIDPEWAPQWDAA